jgi:hypothetical protein
MSEQIKSKSTDQKVVDTTANKDSIVSELTLSKEYKYVVLMETSGEECESWYYCIRYEGNEDNLKHLQDQLESVDWYILDDLSTFDLDTEHFISEKTAKELTKIELNHYAFHRKFDGVLDKIDIHLRTKDNNEKKMVKVFDILGYGQIEDYIDHEDLDEEDLTDTHQSSSDEYSSSDEDSEDKTENVKKERKKGIPLALQKSSLPRFARDKRRQHKV